jgi:hypothetical protein
MFPWHDLVVRGFSVRSRLLKKVLSLLLQLHRSNLRRLRYFSGNSARPKVLNKAYMQERRRSSRSHVLKGAKIVLGTSSVIDCVVRNVTNAGARIQIANTVELPEGLGLSFDGGFSIRPCRIAWRTVTETGVEFI